MNLKHTETLALLGLSLIIGGGCSAIQNMDQMKEMTEDMSKTTDDMKKLTMILQRESRQGASRVARKDELDRLTSDGLSLEARMVSAAAYYSAFEFQLWENIMADDEPRRIALLAEGAEEFMVSLRGVIDGKFKSPNPLSKKVKMEALLALAATVERLNSLQIDTGIRTGFKPTSMFDLIIDTLTRKAEYDANPEAAPVYASKILQFEDEARYLLELRYNIFPAIIVDKIYNASQLGLVGKLELFLKKRLVVNLADLNSLELTEMTNKYISESLFVRRLSRDLGSPIKMNKTLGKILAKAEFKDDPTASNGKLLATEKFKAALKELLCETDVCPRVE